MKFFEKYNLYKKIQSNNSNINFTNHYLYHAFETVIDGKIEVFSEKRFPNYSEESKVKYYTTVKNDKKTVAYEGLFARIIHSLLEKKYSKLNGKNK